VKVLGHIKSDEGVSTDPSKIKAVKEWPIPRNVKEVRSFLGLTSYYRKFIYKYADKAKALHKITEKNQKFTWTEASFNLSNTSLKLAKWFSKVLENIIISSR
jgi:hypothetical protein